MRKVKCRVCGFKFELEKEHVYAASFQSSEGKTFVMKVIDCPRCSCQRVLVPYFKPLPMPSKLQIEDELPYDD